MMGSEHIAAESILSEESLSPQQQHGLEAFQERDHVVTPTMRNAATSRDHSVADNESFSSKSFTDDLHTIPKNDNITAGDQDDLLLEDSSCLLQSHSDQIDHKESVVQSYDTPPLLFNANDICEASGEADGHCNAASVSRQTTESHALETKTEDEASEDCFPVVQQEFIGNDGNKQYTKHESEPVQEIAVSEERKEDVKGDVTYQCLQNASPPLTDVMTTSLLRFGRAASSAAASIVDATKPVVNEIGSVARKISAQSAAFPFDGDVSSRGTAAGSSIHSVGSGDSHCERLTANLPSSAISEGVDCDTRNSQTFSDTIESFERSETISLHQHGHERQKIISTGTTETTGVALTGATPSSDHNPANDNEIHSQSFWKRFIGATASATGSIIKVTSPVLVDAGSMIKEIAWVDSPVHSIANTLQSNARETSLSSIVKSDASTNTLQHEQYERQPCTLTTNQGSEQTEIISVDASCSVVDESKLASALQKLASPVSTRAITEDADSYPSFQSSQESTLGTSFAQVIQRDCEMIATDLVGLVAKRLESVGLHETKCSKWMRPSNHRDLLESHSVSGWLSAPGSPPVPHLDESSLVGSDFVLHSESKESPLLSRPARSYEELHWNTAMIPGYSTDCVRAENDDSLPTDFVLVAPCRSKAGTKKNDRAFDSSLIGSFSCGTKSRQQAFARYQRSSLRSLRVGSNEKLETVCSGASCSSLGGSNSYSKRGGSFCATFPAPVDESIRKRGMASFVGFSSDVRRLKSPLPRRSSHGNLLLSPRKGLKQSTSFKSRQGSSIFRKGDNRCVDGFSLVSPQETTNKNALVKPICQSPTHGSAQVCFKSLRRTCSSPALHRGGSWRSSPVMIDQVLPEAVTRIDSLKSDVGEEYIVAIGGRTGSILSGEHRAEGDVVVPYRSEGDEDVELGALLEDVLVNFSGVKTIQFRSKTHTFSGCTNQAASTLWQQTVAYWKHAEAFRSVSVQRPSLHFKSYTSLLDTVEYEPFDESSDSLVQGRSRDSDRERLFQQKCAPESTKNVDGFDPGARECIEGLTSFVPALGKLMSRFRGHCTSFQHCVPPSAASIESLIDIAINLESRFASIVMDIVFFAEREYQRLKSDTCFDDNAYKRAEYSTNIKSSQAIREKADRKYNGNIMQVRDVLRGRIIFPDEKSLVCGLVRLCQINEAKGSRLKISIVRFKNMFVAASELNCRLPTGYRHILINLCFDDQLIVELQLNLAKLFYVLGDQGPMLHKDLVTSAVGHRENAGVFNRKEMIHQIFSLSDAVFPIRDVLPNAFCDFQEHGGNTFDSQHASQSTGKDGGLSEETHGSSSARAEPGGETEDFVSLEEDMPRDEYELKTDSSSDAFIFLAMIQLGGQMAADNPRDVPCHYCMYSLLMYLAENGRYLSLRNIADESLRDKKKIIECARKYLKQCLTLSSQSAAMGMTGWLEFGEAGLLASGSELPFGYIYSLACSFALTGSWTEVEDVLHSLVLRCEQRLPLYHPLVLISMLDLAGAASQNCNDRLANQLTVKALRELSVYLAEMETLCFNQLAELVSSGSDGDGRIKVEFASGDYPFCMLRSFVNLLQNQLRRDLLCTLGADHDITLISHSLTADTLAMEANFLTIAESFFETLAGDEAESMKRWDTARFLYMKCFDALSKSKGIDDSRTILAAYGAARCMRQDGKVAEAMELLSLVVDRHRFPCSSDGFWPVPGSINCRKPSRSSVSSFIPRPPCLSRNPLAVNISHPKAGVDRDLAVGYCQWLMAALVADVSPRDTLRCLRLLELSSKSLQAAASSHMMDSCRRNKCLGLLQVVDDERERILKLSSR